MRAALAEKQGQLTLAQRALADEALRREKAETAAGETESVKAELEALRATFDNVGGDTEAQLKRLLSEQRRGLEGELDETKEALAAVTEKLAKLADESKAELERQLNETREPLETKVKEDATAIKSMSQELLELKTQLVLLSDELSRLKAEKAPKKKEEPKKEPKERKKGTVVGGKLVMDESSEVPLVDQLRSHLVKNSVRVLDLFREWDEDGDGRVTKKEFRSAMPLLVDGPVAIETVDALWATFDLDGGGEIEYQELSKLMQKAKSEAAAAEREKDKLKKAADKVKATAAQASVVAALGGKGSNRMSAPNIMKGAIEAAKETGSP